MIKTRIHIRNDRKETGASTATISRVKRSLQWGNDAYTVVLDRMNIETNE